MFNFVSVGVHRASFSLRSAVASGDITLQGPSSLSVFEGYFVENPMQAERLYRDYLDVHDLAGLQSVEAILGFTRTSLLPGLLGGQADPSARIHFDIDDERWTFEARSGQPCSDQQLREADWLVRMDGATLSAWMRSFLPAAAVHGRMPLRTLARNEANLVYGGDCPQDNSGNCSRDAGGEQQNCFMNTRDPNCFIDLCWFLNPTPYPEPGCSAEACGADGCNWDACGVDGCGGAACGFDACGAAACGADGCGAAGCGADACGGNACGADGGPIGGCPANACPANVL